LFTHTWFALPAAISHGVLEGLNPSDSDRITSSPLAESDGLAAALQNTPRI
jgi:hypothetical protein